MKLIYSHPNVTYVDMMRSLLANESIPSMIRNHRLMGEGAFTNPELWVADEDVFLAQSILTQHQDQPSPDMADWTCPRCGAENEGNMGICWNCDYEIDGPATP
jgi:hypothetical protein